MPAHTWTRSYKKILHKKKLFIVLYLVRKLHTYIFIIVQCYCIDHAKAIAAANKTAEMNCFILVAEPTPPGSVPVLGISACVCVCVNYEERGSETFA